jgi:hypothetical protein
MHLQTPSYPIRGLINQSLTPHVLPMFSEIRKHLLDSRASLNRYSNLYPNVNNEPEYA